MKRVAPTAKRILTEIFNLSSWQHVQRSCVCHRQFSTGNKPGGYNSTSEDTVKASKAKPDKQFRFLASREPAYKAVIFDKDGTLICLHSMWFPWAKKVANNISEQVNMNMFDEIFSVLGICSQTNKVTPGLLAEGTNAQMAEALVCLLVDRGVDESLAKAVTEAYVHNSPLDPENLRQLHDLNDLFTLLRQHDIRVGVCTSDKRSNTLETLSQLDVTHLVDILICGDDPDGEPKPSPRNANRICAQLQVKPEEVVMVGDSATDMQFAKNGKFGLAVGVLSGTAKQAELENAWHGTDPSAERTTSRLEIIPSVADIIPIVLPDRAVSVHMNEVRSEKECRLVIFDKNGSLTSIYPRWSKWAEELASRLEASTSAEMAQKFLDILGYSPVTRRVTGGLLAESSLLHIRESMGHLLLLNGFGLKGSEEIVSKVWFTPDLDSGDVLPGVVDTLKQLHSSGLRLALNSSDDRAACNAFLDHSNLKDEFTVVLSAEDAGRHPKPLPHSVYRIMEETGCQPNETMVVGDCPADLISGRAAGVTLKVGVLSGFSMAHNLMPHADLLTPNVTYLPEVLRQLKADQS